MQIIIAHFEAQNDYTMEMSNNKVHNKYLLHQSLGGEVILIKLYSERLVRICG